MPISDNATLGIALAGVVTGTTGAVLGIINTWHQLSKDKVRLRVIPKIAFTDGRGGTIVADRWHPLSGQLMQQGMVPRLCIEVLNLSSFPVTVADVGFGRIDSHRAALIQPETNNKNWPCRLKPREAVTAYGGVGIKLDPKVVTEPVAFATTDCDHTAYGRSPFFTSYWQALTNEAAKAKN